MNAKKTATSRSTPNIGALNVLADSALTKSHYSLSREFSRPAGRAWLASWYKNFGKDIGMSTADAIRDQIAALVRQYYQARFADRTFNPQTDLVHYGGRVFDDEELCSLVDASLDFFLTANRYADRFESEFADYMGVSNALLVNSGSSANLVALTTLTSPKLGDRRLQPGDEVAHGGGGLPHHRRADRAEQSGAGVRRHQPWRLHGHPRAAGRRPSVRARAPS